MAHFSETNAYAAKEGAVYFDDGREIALLQYVYGHESVEEFRGSPRRVLQAIDEYGRGTFMMNVGQDKGKIVTDLIARTKPKLMVELGGYVGYSALLFGDALRRAGGQRYFSLERNAVFAAVIMALVDLAGLGDIVKVVVGPSAASLQRLHAAGTISRIDLLFLDHHKPAYTADLKLCEQLALIGPGSVLAADNVILPGNPPYLEYVRSSVEEKRKRKEAGAHPTAAHQQFPEHTKNQYGGETANAGTEMAGNPDLMYESELVKSFEPTGAPDGVEITRCVGEESS
ncbi:MAG: hypothetical protein M1826_007641 [Phylliscum demangeonii]|nr:MAG: hypothetical protein M1826_007641 [Phylliscum demangeonii]